MYQKRKPRVLVVENTGDWARIATEALAGAGYEVSVAGTADDAETALGATTFDAAVFDLHLEAEGERGDQTGFELARKYAGMPRIVWTAEREDGAVVISAHREGMIVCLKSGRAAGLVNAVKQALGTRVFLVHGRDLSSMQTVQWFLRAHGLHVIVLADSPGTGTIIDLFEKYAQVDYAVVLLTADDEGKLRGSPDPLKPRPRQNVVFELGYFCAALGRERVFPLCPPDVDPPSDYSGVRYIAFGPETNWQQRLLEEFKHLKVPVTQ